MKTKLAGLAVLMVAPLIWGSASMADPKDAPVLELSAHMRDFLKQEALVITADLSTHQHGVAQAKSRYRGT